MDSTRERQDVELAQATVLDALETLRKRLLDTSARNPLVNFRHTKRGSLRVIDELPDQLEAIQTMGVPVFLLKNVRAQGL